MIIETSGGRGNYRDGIGDYRLLVERAIIETAGGRGDYRNC